MFLKRCCHISIYIYLNKYKLNYFFFVKLNKNQTHPTVSLFVFSLKPEKKKELWKKHINREKLLNKKNSCLIALKFKYINFIDRLSPPRCCCCLSLSLSLSLIVDLYEKGDYIRVNEVQG